MAGIPAVIALQTGVVETVTRRPVLVAVAALVLVALVVVGWVVVRRFRRPAAVRFQRVLADRDAVAVLMHPNPDPDAMASALAVAHIATDAGTTATLQHPGQIRHQENRVFANVLGVDIERVEDASDLAADAVVLVDHNEPRGFAGAGGLRPVAVVDHHPGGGDGTAFTDVRADYGACATIFAEYLADLDYEPAANGGTDAALPDDLATGLLYGILSDTKSLTRGMTPPDFDAGGYLCEAVDSDDLARIANPEVDADVLDVKARAVTHRRTRGPYVISDVGEVENVDAIAQAADELLRLEGTTAVVVFGDHDGTLYLSGRSRDDRVHMGKTLQSVVDDIPMAEAGGHSRMGGGQCSLDHMAGIGPGNGVSRDELREALFDALAGDL
ncbi:MAG: bifunctional oligoribonuclease/PAP phosphatase NrnA [Haloarculaceae archaeon]